VTVTGANAIRSPAALEAAGFAVSRARPADYVERGFGVACRAECSFREARLRTAFFIVFFFFPFIFFILSPGFLFFFSFFVLLLSRLLFLARGFLNGLRAASFAGRATRSFRFRWANPSRQESLRGSLTGR